MIEKLLELDARLLVPLVMMVAGVALTKGAFSLSRFRSQDRKDFLELCRGHDLQSDLWLTIAVRHAFGAYLPAPLIRQLMTSSQPGRALLEVAAAWDFLDMDDETSELRWRRKWLRRAGARRLIARVVSVLYFVSALLCSMLAYLCLTGVFNGPALEIAWIYVLLSGVAAVGSLLYGDNLKGAERAASRWLGMT